MDEKAQAVDRVVGTYWLPEIVHLHLTALEAGWLTAVLQMEKVNDVEVNVRGPGGEKVPSTMCQAIRDKLIKAWENRD
jgi:hypothetical protein